MFLQEYVSQTYMEHVEVHGVPAFAVIAVHKAPVVSGLNAEVAVKVYTDAKAELHVEVLEVGVFRYPCRSSRK